MDKDAAALVLQARHRQCVEELFDDYAEDFDEHLSSLGWWETSILRCSRFPLLLGEMLNLRSWVLRNKNGILNGYNMLTIKNEFEFGWISAFGVWLVDFFWWKSGHSPQILFKPLVVWASRYTTGQKLQEIHVSLLRSSLLLSLLYHYYHHSKCVVHTKILLFLFMIWNYCVLFWHVYGVLNCLLYYYHFLFWHISFRFTFMSTFHHGGWFLMFLFLLKRKTNQDNTKQYL